MDYCFVFFIAFLSATILPLGSEGVLLFYVTDGSLSVFALWLVASVGNTLGGVVNWWLGLYLLKFEDKKWFPIRHGSRVKAERIFKRYGIWSLLFTWLPVVGDGIALISGVLRTSIWYVLPLVFAGKAIRYALLVWGQNLFFS